MFSKVPVNSVVNNYSGALVVVWYGAGLVIVSSRGRISPATAAIPQGSVNEYQRKLGSKRAYHAMH